MNIRDQNEYIYLRNQMHVVLSALIQEKCLVPGRWPAFSWSNTDLGYNTCYRIIYKYFKIAMLSLMQTFFFADHLFISYRHFPRKLYFSFLRPLDEINNWLSLRGIKHNIIQLWYVGLENKSLRYDLFACKNVMTLWWNIHCDFTEFNRKVKFVK